MRMIVDPNNWNAESDYVRIESPDELPSDFGNVVAVDLEGEPGAPTRKGKPDRFNMKVYSVQVCDRPGRAYYALGEHALNLARAMMESERNLVFHNFKFDAVVLENAGVAPRCDDDTMLMAFVTDPNDKGGLKGLAAKYLHANQPAWSESLYADERIFARYACGDAELTRMVYALFHKKVPTNTYRIEMALLPVLLEMERLGVRIDVEQLEWLKGEYRQAVDAIRRRMFGLAGGEFNPNSPKQIAEILFTRLDLPVITRTASGQPSTSKEVLKKLEGTHPMVNFLQLHRRLSKKLSTYIEGLPEHIHEDGRVHMDILQTVTPTMRLASTSPNLMNQPKRAETALERKLHIRKVFIPSEGFTFLAADYSQIEFRLMIASSKSEDLIQRMENGEDFHITTATILTGKDRSAITREEREKAKTLNFALSYGMDEKGISYRLGVPQVMAKQILYKFRHMYPGLMDWMEGERAWARQHGMSRTFLGPLRELPDLDVPDKGLQSKALRNAVNDQVQGGAAEIFKMGLIRLYKKKPDWLRMLIPVHDEILVEVPEEQNKVEVAGGVMKSSLEVKLGQHVYPVEFSSGPSWADLEKFEV